ncbi:MAG: glycosyltransferase [Bacteriovorax sp.]|jgi:glycosyltransferase involved in cell wall biosynthesis
MIKKKIWILNYIKEDLQSVNQISRNLSRLYFSLPENEYEILELKLIDPESNKTGEAGLRELLLNYKKDTPDHVAIINPGVVAHPFFSSILNIKVAHEPQYLFHVFGNFVRNAKTWYGLSSALINKNVQFVAASICYKEVLSHFIAMKNLSLLPFMIDQAFEQINVSNEDEVSNSLKILYAGRYHEQKNVTLLIKFLSLYAKLSSRNIQLSLITYFDDFNPTTVISNSKQGNQYKAYVAALNHVSQNFSVRLLPHQDVQELKKSYSAHDVFMSFSTFFDEDFGMAIMESLSQGTPCIVSSWGGYKDFIREFPDDCFGLNVSLEQKGLYLSTEKFQDYMEIISKKTTSDRLNLSEKIKKYNGSAKIQEELKKIFTKKSCFKQFDPSLLDIKIEDVYNSFWKTS